MKKISFCLPCYNEAENIPIVYKQLTTLMQSLPQYDYEMIFEDNCSQDGTQDVLRDIANGDLRVKVILNTRNFGPSRSGKNCCFNASGDVIVCVASDLQTPVDLIPKFLKYWEEGYKVVMGQKLKSKESRIKFLMRKIYYKLIKIFSDVKQYEEITGFGAIDRSVYRIIFEMKEYDMSIRHILAELGYEIKLITYEQPPRIRGKSSYNLWRCFEFSITSLVRTSKLPLRMATLLGFGSSIVCMCIGLFYFIYKLLHWASFSTGMVPAVIGIFFIGSIQLFFVGIIGEYLGVVCEKMNGKPIVVELERINFNDTDILLKD